MKQRAPVYQTLKLLCFAASASSSAINSVSAGLLLAYSSDSSVVSSGSFVTAMITWAHCTIFALVLYKNLEGEGAVVPAADFTAVLGELGLGLGAKEHVSRRNRAMRPCHS